MKIQCSWLFRLYVSLSVMLTSVVGLMGWLDNGRGSLAFPLILMLSLAVACLLDVIINDLLPDRYSLTCTHRHRHVVFMLLAMGQIGLILQLVGERRLSPDAIRYLLDALASTAVAGLGVYYHYNNGKIR